MKADIDRLLSPRKRKWKAEEAGALLLMIFAQWHAKWNYKENGDPYAFPIKREITPEDMRRATGLIETELEAYYKYGEATGTYTEKEINEYILYKDVREFLDIAIRIKVAKERVIATAVDGKSAIVTLSTSALIHENEAEALEEAQNADEVERPSVQGRIEMLKNCAIQLKAVAIEREKNITDATEEAFRYLVTFDETMDILADVAGIKEIGLLKSGSVVLRQKLEEVEALKRKVVDMGRISLPLLDIEALCERPSTKYLRERLQVKKQLRGKRKADIYALWRITENLHTRIENFSIYYNWKGGGEAGTKEK